MSSHEPSSLCLTRRQWTALAAALTPLSLAAQTTKTPPAGSPVPPPPPATPEQRLQKAYADIKQVSGTLSKLELPYEVEPAFAFRP